MVRLNMWQRIGVVLSVLWIVGGIGYGSYRIDTDAYQMFDPSFRDCMEVETRRVGASEDDCVKIVENVKSKWVGGEFKWLFIRILSITAFAWVVVYVTTFAARWIAAGKR